MKTFIGESTNGSIQEAIDDAIAKAKETIPTDFVDWKIESITGTDGGFVQVRNVQVTISVKPSK